MNTLDSRCVAIQDKLAASFDLVFRHVHIEQTEAWAIFLSSLTDSKMIAEIIESMVITGSKGLSVTFYPGSVDAITDLHKAILQILSGQCVVIIAGDEKYYCIETRQYPSRQTAEPSVEKSIRGSHDGFVENIILNVGLLRRRIRDPRLRIILNKEGVKTRTDIAYAYIEKLVDPDILQDFENRLLNLDETEILSERNLCEELYGKTMNPYPHVRYTERPDICSIHLLQGYLVVVVDNSPTAMIIPTTFFEQTKQIEEYTQTPLIACFTRIIRLIGIFFSLYLIPLWIVINVTHNPTMLAIPLLEIKPAEFAFQILFADIVVEWIRQALIHTPTVLSGIMGFIAVFLLGDTAVELGATTKETLAMIALVNIGNLITPSYELSLANKAFRILIGALSLLFGLKGFCLGIFLHILILMSTKTVKYPYLYPFLPFSYKALKKIFFGSPIQIKKP